MILAYTHAGMMITGLLVLLCGILIARFMKKKTWWLKTHRTFGITGAVIVILAFIVEAFQISLTGKPHFRVLHAYVGITTICIAILTPVIGLSQFKLRESIATIRLLHVLTGWITIILMVINTLLGLLLIKVI